MIETGADPLGRGRVFEPPVDPATTVTGVETYAVAVPLRAPIADATAHLTHWIVPVVEVRTAGGLVGTGISGVHTGAELLCATITEHYAPRLLGADSSDIRGLWTSLYRAPLHWVGRAGVSQMALAMVDIALWDLAAQRAGMPLWQLLGATAAPTETYNTDGGWLTLDTPAMVASLRRLVDQGWSRVKIKLGLADWREDAARARAVRRALGDDVTLMADANQKWDRITAGHVLNHLEDLGVEWIEEPLHPEDVEGHAALQRSTRLSIAAGESMYSFQSFATMLRADAIQVVQVDATRVGGITEWLQVAALAASNGVRVAPHAGDMTQVHQHLVGSTITESPDLLEYIPWTARLHVDPTVVKDGILVRPSAPGASTAIRPDARESWGIKGVGATRVLE